MTIGTPLHRAKVKDRYDAIVIGSGLGGLTAAAILAKAGQNIAVFERHYTAGGFTHTFMRKGYEWDVGVHYVGDVHRPHSAMHRIFSYVTGGNLKWEPMPDVYDRIKVGNEVFDYVKGEEPFLKQMIAYFPSEEPAIRSYIKLIKQVSRSASKFFALQTLPAWLAKILYSKLSREFLSYAKLTTGEVLDGLTANSKLKAVLAGQWGDYGLPPEKSSFAMHALVAKYYLNGANYPIGGASRIAQTIAEELAKYDADLITNAGVDQILCEGTRAVGVKLHNGKIVYADKIISAAGVKNTFLRLLPQELPAVKSYGLKLASIPASMAHVCLYIGLKENLSELGVPASNLWIYKNENYDDILTDLSHGYKGEFPLVYISFPSSKDPVWAEKFAGRSTIEIVAPSPYHWFERWKGLPWQKRGGDYDALKADITEKLLETLYHQFPVLKGKIHYSELSTPLSTAHFCNYQQGEIYGLDHSPERFKQAWLRSDTSIKNLFITGQDIVSCGVGGALHAGALTAMRILGLRRGKRILRLL